METQAAMRERVTHRHVPGVYVLPKRHNTNCDMRLSTCPATTPPICRGRFLSQGPAILLGVVSARRIILRVRYNWDSGHSHPPAQPFSRNAESVRNVQRCLIDATLQKIITRYLRDELIIGREIVVGELEWSFGSYPK